MNTATHQDETVSTPRHRPEHSWFSQAALDVTAERRRQIEREGWMPEHDDEHVNDELAAMAAFYAMPEGAREWSATETGYGDTFGEAIRPEGWEPKVGDRRRELVKAGALILAEIERIDRQEAKTPPERVLWAMHIPGPDDLYAAPSKEDAQRMCDAHNASIREFFAKRPDPEGHGPSLEACLGVVAPWGGSAESHAESLAEHWPEWEQHFARAAAELGRAAA